MEMERRVADDGQAYTKAEFIEYFGGTDEWDAADPGKIEEDEVEDDAEYETDEAEYEDGEEYEDEDDEYAPDEAEMEDIRVEVDKLYAKLVKKFVAQKGHPPHASKRSAILAKLLEAELAKRKEEWALRQARKEVRPSPDEDVDEDARNEHRALNRSKSIAKAIASRRSMRQLDHDESGNGSKKDASAAAAAVVAALSAAGHLAHHDDAEHAEMMKVVDKRLAKLVEEFMEAKGHSPGQAHLRSFREKLLAAEKKNRAKKAKKQKLQRQHTLHAAAKSATGALRSEYRAGARLTAAQKKQRQRVLRAEAEAATSTLLAEFRAHARQQDLLEQSNSAEKVQGLPAGKNLLEQQQKQQRRRQRQQVLRTTAQSATGVLRSEYRAGARLTAATEAQKRRQRQEVLRTEAQSATGVLRSEFRAGLRLTAATEAEQEQQRRQRQRQRRQEVLRAEAQSATGVLRSEYRAGARQRLRLRKSTSIGKAIASSTRRSTDPETSSESASEEEVSSSAQDVGPGFTVKIVTPPQGSRRALLSRSTSIGKAMASTRSLRKLAVDGSDETTSVEAQGSAKNEAPGRSKRGLLRKSMSIGKAIASRRSMRKLASDGKNETTGTEASRGSRRALQVRARRGMTRYDAAVRIQSQVRGRRGRRKAQRYRRRARGLHRRKAATVLQRNVRQRQAKARTAHLRQLRALKPVKQTSRAMVRIRKRRDAAIVIQRNERQRQALRRSEYLRRLKASISPDAWRLRKLFMQKMSRNRAGSLDFEGFYHHVGGADNIATEEEFMSAAHKCGSRKKYNGIKDGSLHNVFHEIAGEQQDTITEEKFLTFMCDGMSSNVRDKVRKGHKQYVRRRHAATVLQANERRRQAVVKTRVKMVETEHADKAAPPEESTRSYANIFSSVDADSVRKLFMKKMSRTTTGKANLHSFFGRFKGGDGVATKEQFMAMAHSCGSRDEHSGLDDNVLQKVFSHICAGDDVLDEVNFVLFMRDQPRVMREATEEDLGQDDSAEKVKGATKEDWGQSDSKKKVQGLPAVRTTSRSFSPADADKVRKLFMKKMSRKRNGKFDFRGFFDRFNGSDDFVTEKEFMVVAHKCGSRSMYGAVEDEVLLEVFKYICAGYDNLDENAFVRFMRDQSRVMNAPRGKNDADTDKGEVWACSKGCGFSGTFLEVSRHEATCVVVPAAAVRAPEKAPEKPAGRKLSLWACSNGCGFSGPFLAVEAHEATCVVAAPAAAAPAAAAPEEPSPQSDIWACSNGCGFAGSFAAVEAHEATCVVATAPPTPPPEDPSSGIRSKRTMKMRESLENRRSRQKKAGRVKGQRGMRSRRIASREPVPVNVAPGKPKTFKIGQRVYAGHAGLSQGYHRARVHGLQMMGGKLEAVHLKFDNVGEIVHGVPVIHVEATMPASTGGQGRQSSNKRLRRRGGSKAKRLLSSQGFVQAEGELGRRKRRQSLRESRRSNRHSRMRKHKTDDGGSNARAKEERRRKMMASAATRRSSLSRYSKSFTQRDADKVRKLFMKKMSRKRNGKFDFRDFFNRFNGHDDFATEEEFMIVAHKCGSRGRHGGVTDATLKNVFNHICASSDGTLGENNFVRFMRDLPPVARAPRESKEEVEAESESTLEEDEAAPQEYRAVQREDRAKAARERALTAAMAAAVEDAEARKLEFNQKREQKKLEALKLQMARHRAETAAEEEAHRDEQRRKVVEQWRAQVKNRFEIVAKRIPSASRAMRRWRRVRSAALMRRVVQKDTEAAVISQWQHVRKREKILRVTTKSNVNFAAMRWRQVTHAGKLRRGLLRRKMGVRFRRMQVAARLRRALARHDENTVDAVQHWRNYVTGQRMRRAVGRSDVMQGIVSRWQGYKAHKRWWKALARFPEYIAGVKHRKILQARAPVGTTEEQVEAALRTHPAHVGRALGVLRRARKELIKDLSAMKAKHRIQELNALMDAEKIKTLTNTWYLDSTGLSKVLHDHRIAALQWELKQVEKRIVEIEMEVAKKAAAVRATDAGKGRRLSYYYHLEKQGAKMGGPGSPKIRAAQRTSSAKADFDSRLAEAMEPEMAKKSQPGEAYSWSGLPGADEAPKESMLPKVRQTGRLRRSRSRELDHFKSTRFGGTYEESVVAPSLRSREYRAEGRDVMHRRQETNRLLTGWMHTPHSEYDANLRRDGWHRPHGATGVHTSEEAATQRIHERGLHVQQFNRKRRKEGGGQHYNTRGEVEWKPAGMRRPGHELRGFGRNSGRGLL